MELQFEEWLDVFPNLIPGDLYEMELNAGEEHGLLLHLTGRQHSVSLDFGLVYAVNILEEGVCLNDPLGLDCSKNKVPRPDFPSTIYEIKNGRYAKYVESMIGSELYASLHLRQYNVVTMDYVVMIIAGGSPIITIASAEPTE